MNCVVPLRASREIIGFVCGEPPQLDDDTGGETQKLKNVM